MYKKVIEEISELGNEKGATFAQRFFQTQKGGYGEGDLFIGAAVPPLRKIAAKYSKLDMEEVIKLLRSEIHEARFVALVILIKRFKLKPKEVLSTYLDNTHYINNWDLVDISAPHIIGIFCLKTGNTETIWKLAESEYLWENRMAIVSTFPFIKADNYMLTLELSKFFVDHKHHLIHKACGWMLKEIGKRTPEMLIDFVRNNKLSNIMKNTALKKVKKIYSNNYC